MLERKDLEMISEIIERVVEPLKTDVGELKTDVRELKTDVRELKTDVEELKTDVRELKTDVGELQTDVGELKTDAVTLKSDMRALQLTLENETNKGINIIAEGHLDLSRKLDEALTIENEKEMLKLRVNRLESEVEKLKAKAEEIA